MIAEEQNIALVAVGNAALKNPAWSAYAQYCLARENGLRKKAFLHLASFLTIAATWTFEQKKEFLQFLFPFFESVVEADYGPFPQPLSEKLAKPTLETWCLEEQQDEQPFRWYGTYYKSEEHLLRALALNPQDDISREQLLTWWMDSLYYSLHHLPESYIGEPKQDLELAQKISAQIVQLTDTTLKDKWRRELEYNLAFVTNYIEWEASAHPNFEQWGKEHNKLVCFGTSSYYYTKR